MQIAKILLTASILIISIILTCCNQLQSVTSVENRPYQEDFSIPVTIEQLPSYLDKFLPEEGQRKTKIIPLYNNHNQYIILCKFTLHNNYENEQLAMEKVARDFIFACYEAAYTSNLDIVSSTIFIKCPNGKPGLSIGIGKKVAATFDNNFWSNRSTPPNEFINWLKKNKHNAPDSFQKCSYSGIYARK